MSRVVTHRYVDPLAQIWLNAARGIGLRVRRSAEVFAATDGRGTLTLGAVDTLDGDDSTAQMIFHELCHALVAGPEAFARADWGMDNFTDRDAEQERACLRTQRVLAGRYGLDGLFAPTTDYRVFWDTLGDDPLADRRDPSVILAIAALARVDRKPWAPQLTAALAATEALARVVRASSHDGHHATEASEPAVDPHPVASLWSVTRPAPPAHPTGLPARAASDGHTCADCAWRTVSAKGHSRCRQVERAIDAAWPACEGFEPALDCQTCGACCREAYGAVELGPRERFLRTHPDFVVADGDFLQVRRQGARCAALTGGATEPQPDGRIHLSIYACTLYADRPRTCRDFTLGSAHCLTARQRVGLSLTPPA